MARARVRAAKPAPNANRITGPKLFAAAIPTKYRPGTDDSKLDESTGILSSVFSSERIAALRNCKRSKSTLYPVAAMTCSDTISRSMPSEAPTLRCTLPLWTSAACGVHPRCNGTFPITLSLINHPPDGTQGSADSFHSKTFRQVMKGHRQISEEARAHSGTESRLRMPNLLPPRAGLARRLAMELQRLPSTDQLYIGTDLVQ